MTTPADVVAAARSWLGVPWLHQGRTRAGIDCAGLLICIARELGLVAPAFDVNGYGLQPDGTMAQACTAHLRPGPLAPGSLLLLQFAGAEPQHLAVIVPYRHAGALAIVHALRPRGAVVEHRIDDIWRRRVAGVFAFPGVS